jgi:GntR family transcriptional regulator
VDLQIDFQSSIPIFEQIADQLLEKIENSQLEPGTQLPTVRQLAVELGINFNTVARAYRILGQKSIITTQRGRGTFVMDSQKATTYPQSSHNRIKELTRFYIRKATYLGFSPEEIKEHFEEIVEENLPKKNKK